MKIGVYGSAGGSLNREIAKKAREIGREIARTGHTLVTGGGTGLSYESVLGAYELGGKCIGFSPATHLEEHIQRYGYPDEGFTGFVFVPREFEHGGNPDVCRKYRNVSSVAAVDAALIIGGGIGTMNEFTIAYDLGKRIGILEGSGGITERAIKTLLEEAAKESDSEVFWDSDPASLIRKISKGY